MACRNSAQIRRANENRIRETMRFGDAWTKEALSDATGLSPATCHNVLRGLLASGEIVEERPLAGEVGRPARRFRLDADRTRLGFVRFECPNRRKRIEFCETDLSGRILRRETREFPSIPLPVLLDATDDFFGAGDAIRAIGISFQGVVRDGRTGAWSCTEELVGLNLSEEFRKRRQVPVALENDVNAAAWGRFLSDGGETDCMAYIAFPKENLFGCGLICDGRILRGSRGFAGEVLYMRNQTWEEQRKEIADPRGRADIVLRMLRPLTALLDPARIVVADGEMPAEEIERIRRESAGMIRSDFLPELRFEPDYAEDNFRGLFDLTKRELYRSLEAASRACGSARTGQIGAIARAAEEESDRRIAR